MRQSTQKRNAPQGPVVRNAPRGFAARFFALLLALVLLAALLAACNKEDDPWRLDASESSSAPEDSESPGEVDTGLPRPENGINPLTGLAAPEGYESSMRPVAVMVANDSQALPQRGLAAASILFEMETEGGVTRLMALYPNLGSVPASVGPVRSTRDQFLQFALPQNALLAHIGASTYAENLLNHLGYQDLDGIYLGNTAYWYDSARTWPRPGGKLNEHSFFTSGELLTAGAAQLELPTTGDARQYFLFAEEEPAASAKAQQIDIVYSATSSGGFIFNRETGMYTKTIFGSPHADEDGTALTFKNIIVLSTGVGYKPDGMVTDFELGEGYGTWFTMGDAVPIRWVKGGPTDPLRLYTPDGKELEITAGKSYVGVLSKEHGSLTYGRFEPPASSTTGGQ